MKGEGAAVGSKHGKWQGGDRSDPDELVEENAAVNSMHGISVVALAIEGRVLVVASVFHSDGVVGSVPVLDEDV